jgi:hypothetical protein
MKHTKKILLTAAAILLSSNASANIVDVQFDNWRNIYMNSQYSNGGASDNAYFYSLHQPYQENLFLSLDLSAFQGASALGAATVSLYIENGFNYGSNFDVELRQVNQYNLGMNMDSADSYFQSAGTAWKDNAGSNLANLNYNLSLFDVTNSQLAVTSGTSPEPSVGSMLSFTVAQEDVQAWLNNPASAVMAIGANNDPWLSMNFDMSQSFISLDTDATLSSTPGDVNGPLGTAALGLLLLGFGVSRKRESAQV